MTFGRRQKVLLGVLGGVAILAILVLWDGGGGDEPVGEMLSERSARLRRAAAEEPLETRVVAVDLGSLEAPAGEFEVGRNPFRYAPAPAPPPPPPVVRPEPVTRPAPKPPPEPVRQVAERRCQAPSTTQLEYLGSFGPSDRRIAVVVSGDEIYNVLEGGMIEGKFRVKEIGYESLALEFPECPEEPARRLPAGGDA